MPPPVACASDGPILLSREGALLMRVRFDEPPRRSSFSRVITTGSHTRRRAVIRALRDGRQLMIQALRQSEGNSLFLFAQNPLPMWVFEMETLQFLQVNDAALRHYGFTRAEFLKMNTGALHPAEEVPKLLGAIRDTKLHEQLSGE